MSIFKQCLIVLIDRKNKWKPKRWLPQDKSKIPLIVFGDGVFGKDSVKMKGLRCGVVGILWKALKRREAEGGLLAVTIDEYKTSRLCSKCGTDSLGGLAHVKGHSVLVCKTCNTLWQRDVNASKNMMLISLSIWKGEGRPKAYSRN
jgi:hypothetical protein